MKQLIIRGGRSLQGELSVSGMKNSALPILFATIVVRDICTVENVPAVSDITVTLRILESMGAGVTWNSEDSVTVDTRQMKQGTAPGALVRCLRGSNYLLGAELARYGRARIGMTGGCSIGARPIDQHIKGFTALGAVVNDADDYVSAVAQNGLHGAKVVLDNISVGATANILIAAATASGTTVIENAAHEPHIVDLASFLNTCGADIVGAGTSIIKVRGVEQLHGCRYRIIPDMIEAGTYMLATAAASGNVILRHTIPRHLEALSAKLREMGIAVTDDGENIRISRAGIYGGANIQAVPYPGFPTDLQPQMTALLSLAQGVSTVKDNVFQKRFRYVDELQRMGAAINVDESASQATIVGVNALHGADVMAPDLRAGAALVVAGLAADGITRIADAEYIERGYVDIAGKLCALGADVEMQTV